MTNAITAGEIEDRLVSAALANTKSVNAAAKKIVHLYAPRRKKVKGKFVARLSIIDEAVTKTLDALKVNPFALCC